MWPIEEKYNLTGEYFRCNGERNMVFSKYYF